MAAGPGGAPHLPPGQGLGPSTELENWNLVASFDGDFGNLAGEWLDTWKFSAVYNLATTDTTLPDTVGYRLQEAYNGFGGPNCHAVDLVPDRFDLQALTPTATGRSRATSSTRSWARRTRRGRQERLPLDEPVLRAALRRTGGSAIPTRAMSPGSRTHPS